MGADVVREVANRANSAAGDGTTTATVLARAIIKEGMKAVAAGMNPMDLKRGIDKASRFVVDELKSNRWGVMVMIVFVMLVLFLLTPILRLAN